MADYAGLGASSLRSPKPLHSNFGGVNDLFIVLAGQMVGISRVDDHLWLASFMHYDLGYFDDETCRLEPIANPFGPKVLPMSPV